MGDRTDIKLLAGLRASVIDEKERLGIEPPITPSGFKSPFRTHSLTQLSSKLKLALIPAGLNH